MKKIYLTLLLAGLSLVAMAQNEKEQIHVQYSYKETTTSSIEELKSLTKEDKNLREKAMLKLELASYQGKIVLSTIEYQPIKEKIESAPKNPVSANEIEDYHFAEDAKKRYVCVTDLIK